jgi:hypothetical protein
MLSGEKEEYSYQSAKCKILSGQDRSLLNPDMGPQVASQTNCSRESFFHRPAPPRLPSKSRTI